MKLFWRIINKRRALSSLARWQSIEEVSTDKVLEKPRPQSLADNLADRAVVIPQSGDKYERQSSFESQPSNVAKAEKTSTVWKTTLEGEETKTWNE